MDILSATRSLFNKTFPTNSIFSGQVEQLWCTELRAKSKCSLIASMDTMCLGILGIIGSLRPDSSYGSKVPPPIDVQC